MPSQNVGLIHADREGEGTVATVSDLVFHIAVLFSAAEPLPNSAQGKMKTSCFATFQSCSGDKVFDL